MSASLIPERPLRSFARRGKRSLTPSRSLLFGARRDVEAEHHAALVVLGDVAVRHPEADVGDVQQDVDRLAGADQHGVLPDQAGLDRPIAGQDQEAAGAVNMERVVHWMVAGASTASSFMPHFGQWSGSSLTTSGCIGQAYTTGPSPSGAPMSISAMKASVLSGSASR